MRTGIESTRPVGRPEDGRSDEGAVAVIVAILLVVLIGLLAFVADAGALYQKRRSLQTASDAAALAGVQELPTSVSAARSKAFAYVALNAPDATDVTVVITSHFRSNDTIQVTARNPAVGLSFASVFDQPSSEPVSAKATARITSPLGYDKGLTPIGVLPLDGNESVSSGYGYAWGDSARIKQGGGSGTTGNYGWVDLGSGGGSSGLREYMAGGGGSAWIGQRIPTVPGNKNNVADELAEWIGDDDHTYAEVCSAPDANGVVHINDLPDDPPEGCHRIIVVPIVVNPNGQGAERYKFPNGKKDMLVIGFAQFFVTYAGGNGNDSHVQGTFIRGVSAEEAMGGAAGTTGQVHYSLVE